MEKELAKMILERMIPKDSRGNGKIYTTLMIRDALNLAIESLEQTEKIIKKANELDISQQDFENMLRVLPDSEIPDTIKDTVWKMYCFTMYVQYTVK